MQTITTPMVSVRNQDVRVFERLESNGILSAYAECVEAKAQPWFIPELVDAKIAPNCNDYLWKNGFTQPSIIVTGRSRAGKAVVVYAHGPNYFSDLENLRTVYQNGLVNGAGIMPQEEFLKLLGLEDEKMVFVRDHQELIDSPTQTKVRNALRHPIMIPFLGGEERAVLYLEDFAKKNGTDMCINITNDLGDVAKGRWLVLGNYFINCNLCGVLGGSFNFSNYGRVLGVESSSVASEASPVVVSPQGNALKDAVSEAKPLEEKVQSALNEGRAFEFNGKLYAPVFAENIKLS